jgi:hypothetical protein
MIPLPLVNIHPVSWKKGGESILAFNFFKACKGVRWMFHTQSRMYVGWWFPTQVHMWVVLGQPAYTQGRSF